MLYLIRGQHRNKVVVDRYVCNLIKALKLHRLSKKFLVIDFKTSLEEGSVLGFCLGDKDRADIEIARTLYGEKLSFMEQMKTIAHEMIHAKQYFRGELMYGDGGDFKWKKRNAGGYKYENQPWEKEAFRRESELFMECFPFDMM